jgi:hypothetical protein
VQRTQEDGVKQRRDKRRNHRTGKGDKNCSCSAYRHTHRLFGGRCSLLRWVKTFFDPYKKECLECINLDEDSQCQVVQQVEAVWHCPALRDYIRFEGIQLYGRAAEQRAESERTAG